MPLFAPCLDEPNKFSQQNHVMICELELLHVQFSHGLPSTTFYTHQHSANRITDAILDQEAQKSMLTRDYCITEHIKRNSRQKGSHTCRNQHTESLISVHSTHGLKLGGTLHPTSQHNYHSDRTNYFR